MNTKTLVTTVIVVVLVIAGIALYQKNSTAPTPTTDTNTVGTNNSATNNTTPSGTNSTATTSNAASSTVNVNITTSTTVTTTTATKEFTVTGNNFAFVPTSLTVNKGDKVKIIFKNSIGTHDLQVEGYNVKTPVLAAGQTATIEFIADKAGSFEYFCSIGNHRAMGMKGSLTVK